MTGYVIMLGDSPIVWSSRLQGVVSTSTVKAEYLALRSAIEDIMCLRHLLSDLGWLSLSPPQLLKAALSALNGLMTWLSPERTGTFIFPIIWQRSK